MHNQKKSFESSLGSGRGLVQTSLVPVVDEKKAEMQRLAEIRRSREEIAQMKKQFSRDASLASMEDKAFKTLVKNQPDTPFVEQ